jgi:flagellar hook-associated protein 2
MSISGGISFGGLGSGLDTNAIIRALLDVERVPINALEAKKSSTQQKSSLIATVEGYVDTLRTRAKELSTLTDFLSVQASNPYENLPYDARAGVELERPYLRQEGMDKARQPVPDQPQ